MNSVQVKVNTFNRLKKIRSGVVYDSVTTVIDELLQNCQRSFLVSETANPVIDIITDDGLIIIRDNGNGCSDPQSVFEFESSGWNISDAFGQGGSESVFQIADSITIRSQNWKASVDVVKMLESENLSVDTEYIDEYFWGYETTLSGPTIKEFLSILESHIENTVKYFNCDTYINGEKVEKDSLHNFKAPFRMTFDNKFYFATLGVQNSFKDCEIYYEKRKVCTVWKHGVYGIIELKRDAVNLKAPDRKSFVHDEKYRDFKKWLDEDCKLLYISFVQQATDAQFEEYEGRIDEILDPKDYADYLPAYDELKYEQSRIKILVQEVPNSRTVEDLAKSDEKIEKQTQVIRSAGSYASYTPEKVEVKPEFVRKKGEMKKRLGKVLNIVWCEFSRKEELTELITKAESAGIKVQFSKGKLYGKAFEFWGIPHIEEIMDKTEAKYIIGRVIGSKNSDDGNYRESTKKEERLLNVLQRIESYYGIEDVFRIADVKEHLSIEHNGEKVIDSVTKATAAPIKDRKKIYLDRSSLNLGKVSISESRSAITKFDVLIVMLNISTIASGLAQLIYNTIDQTVDHYAKVDKISKEIALLMASL